MNELDPQERISMRDAIFVAALLFLIAVALRVFDDCVPLGAPREAKGTLLVVFLPAMTLGLTVSFVQSSRRHIIRGALLGIALSTFIVGGVILMIHLSGLALRAKGMAELSLLILVGIAFPAVLDWMRSMRPKRSSS